MTSAPDPAPPVTGSARPALALAGVAATGVVGLGVVSQLRDDRDGDARSPAVTGTALLDHDFALHVIRRTTFGLAPGLLAELRARGTAGWLDDQLHPERLSDPIEATLQARYPLLGATAAEVIRQTEAADDVARVAQQLVQASLARQIWSRRQLFEVMVEFWSNHFNVTSPLRLTGATKPVEDRAVIRAHALGTFEELLLADASSPAMLLHLGNADSTGTDPNENYGRELLELHTVGLAAGYTEDDVRNSAYVLTGRTVDDNGEFVYRPETHYLGPVAVLGWSAANDSAGKGLGVGADYLRYLARHPQTAQQLSRKLATRFVADDPPERLVGALAQTYLAEDTAIVPWLQALFGSPEFAAAVGAKVRRPLEDLTGTARVLGLRPPAAEPVADATEDPLRALYSNSYLVGQPPLGAGPPTGYPDVAAAWLSTSGALGRWNMHRRLIDPATIALERPPLTDLIGMDPPATMGEVVDLVTTAVTGQRFGPEHRRALLDFLRVTDDHPYDDDIVARNLDELVALALDSPYHLLR